MEFSHAPVMPDECISNLDIKEDGIYVDGTITLSVAEGSITGITINAANATNFDLLASVGDYTVAGTVGTWTGNAYILNNITFTILTDSANNVTGIKLNASQASSAESRLTLGDTLPLESALYDTPFTVNVLFFIIFPFESK